VIIGDNSFSPANLTVPQGSTVTWANKGALPHTVTAKNQSYDSGILMPGGAYHRTFPSTGTFSYFCTIHPGMAGTITVTTGGTPVGTAVAGTDGVSGSSDGTVPADSTSSGAETATQVVEVSVIDLAYDPSDLTVAAGTAVMWTNIGELPHTVTDSAGSFDSGIMNQGGKFQWTFKDPGTYSYFCLLHPGMEATVVVTEAETAVGGSDTPQAAAAVPVGSRVRDSGSPTMMVAIVMAAGLAAAGFGMAWAVGRFSKAADSGRFG
jgi:plastocyanin